MNEQDRVPQHTERRKHARYSIQAPTVATVGNREIWAFTKDVSTTSVYLRIEADETAPAAGDLIGFVIRIPPTMVATTPCFIRGQGRVIRTDRAAWGETGIAAEIIRFEIESSAATQDEDAGSDSTWKGD